MEPAISDGVAPTRRINLIEQDYWCNNCKSTQRSVGLPSNWYMIKRSSDTNADGTNLKTVAILCSLPCIAKDAIDEMAKRSNTAKARY